MSTVQATALAKSTLLTYLQAQVPTVLPAVNAALATLLPGALTDFATYQDFQPTVLPPRPALFVLSQGAARANEGPGYLEAEHSFYVALLVSGSDPRTLTQQLEGYVAAVLNAIGKSRDGQTPVANACTFAYGPRFLAYSPLIQVGTTFNREAYLDVTVRLGELAP